MRGEGGGMEVNDAEEIVKCALMLMKKEKKLVDFIHSGRNDNYDVKGIDFMLDLGKDMFFPIQVKTLSTEASKKQKVKTHLEKHPDVTSVIFVNTNAKNKEEYKKILDSVIKEIEALIKKFLQSRQ